MSLYAEKIAQNDAKIAQLEKSIENSKAKRKKLIEENEHLSYLSIVEEYKCEGHALLEILKHEHEQAEKLKADKSHNERISELTGQPVSNSHNHNAYSG